MISPLRLRRAAAIAGRIVRFAAALTVFGLVVLNVLVPRLTRTVPLTVFTGSMSPTIPRGSLVLTRAAEPEDLAIGDVITFESAPGSSRFTTHRIVGIAGEDEELTFTTKGDANPSNDLAPVPADAVRGRVMAHFPYVGAVADRLRTPTGVLSLLALCAGSIAWATVGERRARRAGDQDPVADDEPELTWAEAPSDAARSHEAQVLLVAIEPAPGRSLRLTELVQRHDARVLSVVGQRATLLLVGPPIAMDEALTALRAIGPLSSTRSSVARLALDRDLPDPTRGDQEGAQARPSFTIAPELLAVLAPEKPADA